ncbi:MAG: peptide ABC transporter ATP-binding protein [Rhizobiales bacterium]|nr:peptide ABC transporter ATP-binding protein [Hyphomicrobiales bacterium]MBA68413.1 peptide ABC transporter ATP-binding protein [Hyphomicrobiales bacterium]|tara:strand:- start:118 stop:1092 length:975 start_codon:yes stop_codon:yes gene_type:complete
MTDPLLNIVDLKTYFRDTRTGQNIKACDGISLDINEGEIVGLVGESGCGKSTLGRTLVGLEDASGGEIRYGGENLLTMHGRKLHTTRRKIQYVFQDPLSSLSGRMTIGQAIEEALIINGERNAAARRARVVELLEAVSLPDQIAERYPREMSGGQRQRACIARSLAADPKVLICDEPVSSLDVSIRAQVMNLFLKLRDEFGLACLLIAHDLAIVRQAASRVYVMYLGRIMEEGESRALYGNPAHPYTQALLSAVPSTNPVEERDRQRILLKGDVPSPINPPSGCRFRGRCPIAQPVCETPPPTIAVDQFHVAACHFPGKLALAG